MKWMRIQDWILPVCCFYFSLCISKRKKKKQAIMALPITFVLLCLHSSSFAWLSVINGSKGFYHPQHLLTVHGVWPHGCVAEHKDRISGFLAVPGQAAAEGFQLPLELKAVLHQWDLETQRKGVNVGLKEPNPCWTAWTCGPATNISVAAFLGEMGEHHPSHKHCLKKHF